MNRLISRCVLAFSASAILSTNVMAADAASCQNVRMGVVNWTDVIATSAMTQVLLDGEGFDVGGLVVVFQGDFLGGQGDVGQRLILQGGDGDDGFAALDFDAANSHE
jgi:hypothetical protein